MVREQQLTIEELQGRLSQLEERKLSSVIFPPSLSDSESDSGSSGISLKYRKAEELEAEREDEKVFEDEQEDAGGKVTPADLNEKKTEGLSKTGVVFWVSTTFVAGFTAGWVAPYFIKKIMH